MIISFHHSCTDDEVYQGQTSFLALLKDDGHEHVNPRDGHLPDKAHLQS